MYREMDKNMQNYFIDYRGSQSWCVIGLVKPNCNKHAMYFEYLGQDDAIGCLFERDKKIKRIKKKFWCKMRGILDIENMNFIKKRIRHCIV